MTNPALIQINTEFIDMKSMTINEGSENLKRILQTYPDDVVCRYFLIFFGECHFKLSSQAKSILAASASLPMKIGVDFINLTILRKSKNKFLKPSLFYLFMFRKLYSLELPDLLSNPLIYFLFFFD